MALTPGHVLLNGQYHIQRLLGQGGFGSVYEAWDTLLDSKVAIKELIPALVGNEALRKRFLAEARATMRLTHRNIVRTFNVFSETDESTAPRYYIVMEYMAGGSLEQRLRERGPLAIDQAVGMAAEVCAGLTCAHDEQVIHCDLKPANILFTVAGDAKVADFGIAHVSQEGMTQSWMTPAGFVAGTLPYMSPEQADGVRDDPRLDLYALGAVLYRALTGRTYLDFDPNETPRAQAANVTRICSETPSPPGKYNAEVPSWLDAVVLRALAKQPEQRFSSAAEMREALLQPDPGPGQAPAPALSLRTVPTTRRFPRRQWFWTIIGALAVLLLMLGIAIALLLRGDDAGSTAGPGLSEIGGTSSPTLAQPPAIAATNTSIPVETSLSAATPTQPVQARPLALEADGTWTRERDGATMILVASGGFVMGSDDGGPDEKPAHTVYLGTFWIDRTEVTNVQYRACQDTGACSPPANYQSPSRSNYYGNPDWDEYPVINVTWTQANEYCAWAGAGLPTEAEWEKAARGTDGPTYPWGEDLDCTLANYSGCEGDTRRVGSALPGASPYGVLDMAGNVWEWVADWYAEEIYAHSPERDPTGPSLGEEKVLRGGSWDSDWYGIRTTARFRSRPDQHSSVAGFRCAVALDE
jgi:formylglycine-generating enzyme required for sulfatase activity/serine/threonine protein kinase